MNQIAEQIEEVLATGDREAERFAVGIVGLTKFECEQEAQRVFTESRAKANALASQALADALARATTAEEAVTAAERAWNTSRDSAKAAVAISDAQAFGEHCDYWPDVTARIEEATRLRDIEQLRALRDHALPRLAQRARGELSRLRQDAGTGARLAREIERTLADLEPERLKVARATFERAKSTGRDVYESLKRINERRALQTGGPGPLAEALSLRQTVQETTPAGGMRFTTTGRWI
jgi:hypothetical protein